MKFYILCLHFLLLNNININLGQRQQHEIRVGGLFEENTEDQQLVFRLAGEVLNRKGLFYNRKIIAVNITVPDDQYIVSTSVCGLLDTGIVGLFGPTRGHSSNLVQSLCDIFEIPHIETRRDHIPNRATCMLNLHPYPPTLALVYAELVRSWKWKSFTILYDTDESLPRINELLKIYDPKGYSVFVRKLDTTVDEPNFRSVLKDAKDNGEKNFVVECSGDNLDEILRQAQQVGMIADNYNYIITTLDMATIDLDPYQYGGANITGVRMIDQEDPDVLETIEQWKDIMNQWNENLPDTLQLSQLQLETALVYDALLMFAEAFYQLSESNGILASQSIDCNEKDNWEHGYSLINFMRMTHFKGLTGIVRFDNQGFRTDFLLEIIELTAEKGIQKIGVWNSTEGLNITRQHVPKPENNEDVNLRNKTFRILTALTAPYGMLKADLNQLTGNDQYEGFGIDVIQELSDLLGFNFTFHIQEDGNYGSKKNGEWNGMMKEIMEGRADLAITDLTITSERESAVDFTSPFMHLGISILFKKATKMPPELFSFMAPFSKELWFYMGVAYFSVSLLLFTMGRLSPYEWTNPYPCVEEPEILLNQFSLTNSLWFTVGSLLQQGTEIAPAATSTRMVAGTWWFFTLIMVSSYTANLAACLTVERMILPIKSAEDLPEQTAIQYGAKSGGTTEGFFRDSTYEAYKKMYQYMTSHPEVMTKSNEEGVLRVQNTNYAYLMESTSIEYITQRNCDLQQVGQPLDEKGYGIAMRKNSTYRNALSTGVLKLQETGKLAKLKDKWWKERRGGGACSDDTAASAAGALGLANVGGVFIVLVVGIITATITAFIEMSFGAVSRSFKYKIPLREELKNEIKFLVRCTGLTKPVRTSSEEEDDTNTRHGSEDDDFANDTYDYAPDITKNANLSKL